MPTKLGYDASLASAGVDWSVVAENFTTKLSAAKKGIEAKRAAENKAHQENLEAFSNVELGRDAAANEWLSGGAASITSMSKHLNNMMANGLMSSKDYLAAEGNVKNGIANVLDAYKGYNDSMEEIYNGIEDGTLSQKTLAGRERLEKIFNFKETGIVTAPNGEISVAKKEFDDEGNFVKFSENPDERYNASEIMDATNLTFKKFDAQKAGTDLVEKLGTRLMKDGFGNSIETAFMNFQASESDKDKREMKAARIEMIKSILNPANAGSVLADYLQEDYGFTMDPEAAAKDEKLILMDANMMNNFDTENGKKQMNRAVEAFDEMLEAMIPRKDEAAQQREQSAAEIERGKGARRDKNTVTILARIQAGQTLEDRRTAAANLAGLEVNKDIVNITEYPDRIIIKRRDENGEIREYPVPRPDSTYNFIEGAATMFTDVDDVTSALRNSGLTKDSRAAKDIDEGGTVLFEVAQKAKPLSAVEVSANYLDNQLQGQPILDETNEDAVLAALVPVLAPYGVTVETSYPGVDEITITSPDKDKEPLTIRLGNFKGAARKDLIEGWLSANLDLETIVKTKPFLEAGGGDSGGVNVSQTGGNVRKSPE